jgi:hypothetical protein
VEFSLREIARAKGARRHVVRYHLLRLVDSRQTAGISGIVVSPKVGLKEEVSERADISSDTRHVENRCRTTQYSMELKNQARNWLSSDQFRMIRVSRDNFGHARDRGFAGNVRSWDYGAEQRNC